jgi:hypothetical protein
LNVRFEILFVIGVVTGCASSPQKVYVYVDRPVRGEPCPVVATASLPDWQGGAAPNETCGELALDRAALVAAGKGEHYPQRMAVEASLAQCTDTKPSNEDCANVRARESELIARGYGASHPDLKRVRAELDVCGK